MAYYFFRAGGNEALAQRIEQGGCAISDGRLIWLFNGAISVRRCGRAQLDQRRGR